jgi:hypothetical protein
MSGARKTIAYRKTAGEERMGNEIQIELFVTAVTAARHARV